MWFHQVFGAWRQQRSRPATRRPASSRPGVETLEGRAVPGALTSPYDLGPLDAPPALVRTDDDDQPAALAAVAGLAVNQPLVYRGEGRINVLPDGSLNPTLTVKGTIIGSATGSASLILAANGQDGTGAGSYTKENGDQLNFVYSVRFHRPAGTVEHN